MHSAPKKGIIARKIGERVSRPSTQTKDLPTLKKVKVSPFIFIFLILLPFFFLSEIPAKAAGPQKKFNLDHEKPGSGSGNIFNLIFGSAPPMATEKGTLIIDAFEDSNSNGRKDEGEKNIDGGISCKVDGIDYTLPAFIPGLKYDNSYDVLCKGRDFIPELSKKNILIARRGEILKVVLPCRRVTPGSPADQPPDTPGVDSASVAADAKAPTRPKGSASPAGANPIHRD
jgi:hypothetical protein